MNYGILGWKPFGVDIDNGMPKPLLGLPQVVPVSYHIPKGYDWMLGNSDGSSSEDFVIVIDTTKGTSTSINMQLLTQVGGNLSIDWGDGTQGIFIPSGLGNVRRPGSYETRLEFFGTFNYTFTPAHTYAKHGIYQIVIKGPFVTTAATNSTPIISTNNLISVLSYGTNSRLTQVNHANATNLIYVPPYLPSSINSLANAFNGCTNFGHKNIESWNTSNVTSMASTFLACTSLGTLNLSGWNVNNVTTFANMFQNANGTIQGLESWDSRMGALAYQNNIFRANANLIIDSNLGSGWGKMFNSSAGGPIYDMTCTFTKSLSGWIIPSGAAPEVKYINFTSGASLDNWVWQNGSSMAGFGNTVAGNNFYGRGLDSWNTSGCTNMSSAFNNVNTNFGNLGYNLNLSGWNTSNVTTMANMFYVSFANSFTGSGLEYWDTSNVTSMANMFRLTFLTTTMNPLITNWNVSKVTSMNSMFMGCNSFNRSLSGWDTSKVTNMASMFEGTTYSRMAFAGSGIDNWNVTGVTTIARMFYDTAAGTNTNLQCNLSGWNLCNCTDMTNFMFDCNIGSGNYDILLNSWAVTSTGNPIKPWATGINVHFGSAKYTAASSGARQRLVNYGWTITDGGLQT